MHHFCYRNGELHAEDVPLSRISEAVGTPFYCYSSATLTRHYALLADAFADLDAMICYSVKANSNLSVLATLADLGAGMDVVSQGELRRARAVGVPGDRIIFAGVGKTRAEMAYALDQDIHSFNVESEAELEALSAVATGKGTTARIAMRVNPDVDPQTHRKISTGQAGTKFGVPYDDARRLYRRAAELPGIQACGVHMHIGSQLTRLQPFDEAFRLMRALIETLRADGHTITHADLGGGLGVPYQSAADLDVTRVVNTAGGAQEGGDGDAGGETDRVLRPQDLPTPQAYGDLVRQHLGDLGLQLALEPGRMIAANAGLLAASVIYEKVNHGQRFIICDAAMNDLIRPTLYEADHEIVSAREPGEDTDVNPANLVGPVCETGDYLALGRPLPRYAPGDLIAILGAGAYGAVQAGTYNTRPLVPEVLVKDDAFAVVRPRQTYEEMLGLDAIADWLDVPAAK